MNEEDRLSKALHAAFEDASPTPELEPAIVERVAATGPRTTRFNIRLGFAGLVAVGLVVAMVPLAIGLRSGGQTGESSSTTPASVPSGSSAPASIASAPTASGSLGRFDRDGLVFDYPASWKASVSGLNMHYVTILDYIGTGSGLATCTAITPGPGDQFISGTQCGSNVKVDPGQLVVTLSRQDGPPRPGPIDPADASALAAGEEYVTVGGLPAVFEGEKQGASALEVTLGWTLSVPGELISRYMISADIKGPGVDQMRAQVEALVASIRYSPAVPVLDPADGPRVAASGLAQVRSWGPEYACFPSILGATATATITEFPGYSSLRKPLPVTCTTAIEPSSIGLWKMTLTESWTAASDRTAGTYSTTVWLAADGTPGTTQGGPGPSEMPYWP
jgi:hypothetical protein